MIGICGIVAALIGCAPGWLADSAVPAAAGAVPGRHAALALPAAAPSASRAAPVVDAWVGEDKVRHFSMSFALVAFGNAAGLGAGLDGRSAAAGAVLGAAAAGVLKELHDQARGGIFSVRDMAWNSAGIVAGIALIRSIR